MDNVQVVSFVLGLYCLFAVANCEQLKVEYLSSKLPSETYCHRVHYDGEDSIYVFGVGNTESKAILKYSIESDTISEVGILSPALEFCRGSIQSDDDGNLFLFSYERPAGRQIIKYNTRENSTEIVATLPWGNNAFPSVKSCGSGVPRNIAFALGSTISEDLNRILLFSLESYAIVESETRLPISLLYAGGICVNGRVFVFPSGSRANQSVWELDLTTLELNPLAQPYFPELQSFHTPISDGSYVYLVAGLELDENSQITSQEGILRLDPVSNSTSFIPVENWPVKDELNESFSYAPQCVYVQKLHRIYCFGGFSQAIDQPNRFHDEIFYIELRAEDSTTLATETTTLLTSSTTMNPDFFSCSNRPNGFYPHPTDCSLFIGCREEELEFFACNPPLLFNPLSGLCDLPEFVDCGTSCIGKVDGAYPHPHDCSLYFLCHSEVMTVAKCPPPLLYDPILSVCNYPDEVECSID